MQKELEAMEMEQALTASLPILSFNIDQQVHPLTPSLLYIALQ